MHPPDLQSSPIPCRTHAYQAKALNVHAQQQHPDAQAWTGSPRSSQPAGTDPEPPKKAMGGSCRPCDPPAALPHQGMQLSVMVGKPGGHPHARHCRMLVTPTWAAGQCPQSLGPTNAGTPEAPKEGHAYMSSPSRSHHVMQRRLVMWLPKVTYD